MEFLRSFFYKFDFGRFMFPSIGLNTIIDILIVAYLVYQLILWIKETKAFALLKGVVVVLFVSMLAFLFNLYTLQWILRGAFSVGVTALIVIFQPELRRALEKIGKGRIGQVFTKGFGSAGRKSVSETSKEEIYTAVIELADTKTGALILIEQQTSLREYEATGISLDADISSELLLNIFVDKAPLHDGAVMIKDNRILTASSIFPLTERELSSDLGTRHRAALGIAEISDAYVIVVSEESGKVSIAHEGNLELDISARRLDDILSKIFLSSDKKDSKKSIFSFLNGQEEDVYDEED